jgi:formylglycine-generating enzyme required for sulfatase activity
MRKLVLIALLLECYVLCNAQIVSNVTAYQQGKNIVIEYDLSTESQVGVSVSLNNGSYTSMNGVSGDVNKKVSPGHKQIIWDVLSQYDKFYFDNVMFKVEGSSDFTETAFGINMKMIWVEGGSFLMGCTSEQGQCDDDEKNVRRVTVDGFCIGMLEVTQSQWEKVMGTSVYKQRNKANPQWNLSGVGPDYPMYYVSWDEATEFCRLLSNKTGKTYTLPTEAQWEYAARGGKKADGTKYAGSNVIDAVAWYGKNSSSTSHVCGSKRANALGIYDMSGNVWEWCKDWYASSYVSYDTNNPTGPSSGSARMSRGGGWLNFASFCRVANRRYSAPSGRGYDLGFRVVCIP